MRNPIAVIKAGLHLLDRARGNVDEQKVRESMGFKLAHMARLIDDLLDINRIEHGKIALQKESIRLDEVMPAALELAGPAIEAANHRLSVEMPDAPLTLEVDPARFIQIISNIVGNAARYTKPGGEIEVRVSRAGRLAEIAVSDNGVGIPPEQQARIFDMFQQSDSDIGIAGGGLGIGLALVKQLVELHGGEIRLARSVPGQGSTFKVTLPLAD